MSASKYDELARYLVDRLGADAVVVVVLNGPFGHGACRAERALTMMPPAEVRPRLIHALREMIGHIERDDIPPFTDPNNTPS